MSQLPTEEIVQAILTADTLIEHYPKAERTLRSALGNDANEYDVQLGEANRTYPSIWEHLDRAYALIAGTGRTVLDYERIRTAAAKSIAVGVETERSESHLVLSRVTGV